MTTDPVLHALVDLCLAVEDDGAGRLDLRHPAYNNALKVIREHTAPGGERSGPVEPALTAWVAAGEAARMQDLSIQYSCTAYNRPLRETDVPLYALPDATDCEGSK